MDSKRILLVPIIQIATIDDKLLKTSSVNNTVKRISHRKAGKEGRSADVVTEAYFRNEIDMRFSLQSDTCASVVKHVTMFG